MIYTDSSGSTVEATVLFGGPLYGTVWALRPDRTYVVVHVGKSVEVEYELPQYLSRIHPEVEKVAREIVEAAQEARRIFASLGAQPIGADHDWAVRVVAMAEDARRSHRPYINCYPPAPSTEQPDKSTTYKTNAHKINQAVGEQRFKALVAQQQKEQ